MGFGGDLDELPSHQGKHLSRLSARVAVAAVDQVVSSGTNFILAVLIATSLPITEFGKISVALAWLSFSLALGRGAVGSLLGIDLPGLPHSERFDYVARSTGAAVALGAVSIVGYVGIAAAYPHLAELIFLIAICSPVLLTQDLWRYWSIADARPDHALISDAVWITVFPLAYAAAISMGSSRAHAAVMGWGIGLICATVIMATLRRARPTFRGMLTLFTDRRRRHLSLDGALATICPLVVTILTIALAGGAVAGAIRGASVVFAPLNVVASTIAISLTPELVRLNRRASRALSTALALILLAVVAGWSATLFYGPDEFGRALIGDGWTQVRIIVPITAIEYASLPLTAIGIAMMNASHRTRSVMNLRIFYSTGATVAAASAAAAVGSAVGVAAALSGVGVIVGTLAFSRGMAYRHPRPASI